MTPTTTLTTDDHDELEYDGFLADVGARLQTVTDGQPLFTTDAENLFDVYLGGLPPEARQHHTCHACRHFINRFGGLVTIDTDGDAHPLFWNARVLTPPAFYVAAVAALDMAVRRAQVTGVFVSSDAVWGQPLSRTAARTWHHFSARPRPERVHRSRVVTPHQASAEKLEDFRNVERALHEFSAEHVATALRILAADALDRSEKVRGPVQWLHALHQARATARGARRENLLWAAVATAPAGFCHPRSSMAGTLLEDLAAGLSFETVAQRFNQKMHPLQYQRPQAAPRAGTIAQAEKLFEELGLAPALRRRYARLEELETLWTPPAPPAPAAAKGVFGHLTPRDAPPEAKVLELPEVTMTWSKFVRMVLPTATKLEYYVAAGLLPLGALVTAEDPEAPPLLQWDRPERRNPVSWYLYHGGSPAEAWGLTTRTFHVVNAVCDRPCNWYGQRLAHFGEGAMLVLEGARDTGRPGLALFPETLRSELHGVRSVLEAHARTGVLSGREQATACGLLLGHTGTLDHRLRVTSPGQVALFKIDRWD